MKEALKFGGEEAGVPRRPMKQTAQEVERLGGRGHIELLQEGSKMLDFDLGPGWRGKDQTFDHLRMIEGEAQGHPTAKGVSKKDGRLALKSGFEACNEAFENITRQEGALIKGDVASTVTGGVGQKDARSFPLQRP